MTTEAVKQANGPTVVGGNLGQKQAVRTGAENAKQVLSKNASCSEFFGGQGPATLDDLTYVITPVINNNKNVPAAFYNGGILLALEAL